MIIDQVLDAQNEVTAALVFEGRDAQFGGPINSLIAVQGIRKTGTTQVTLGIEGGIVQSDGSVEWHQVKTLNVAGTAGAEEYTTQTTVVGTAWRVKYTTAATDEIQVLLTHGQSRILE